MQLKMKAVTELTVKYLAAEVGARYWEDAHVNGVEDTDGTLIPFRVGDHWSPVIDLETGIIQDWPQGTVANIHYKSCDDNVFHLMDENKVDVVKIDGYVIDMMCPEGDGWGDYVIMKVDETGKIANWRVDLKPFEGEKD